MNSEPIRLQKYLANAGIASRRKCEELIVAGRVSVNGSTCTQLGTKILPNEDAVTLDGKVIRMEARLVYIMLHKPEGYITSVSDPQNRPVVTDLVKNIPERLFPVGRLDYDSSGLLILTNDGQLAQKLTHPSNLTPKTYIAKLCGIPDKKGLAAFRTGLIIDRFKTAPAKIKILDKKPSGCTVQITIHEGKNRQIRKMCDAIGCPCLLLKRVAIGQLNLSGLARGKFRHLSNLEVQLLF